MAVNHEALRLLYRLSPSLPVRDQRFLSAIGLEFEAAEFAFDQLIQICVQNTDSGEEKWNPEKSLHAKVQTLAMAFVDHSVRLQKILKVYVADDADLGALTESFYSRNLQLFLVRQAINHSYSRIDSHEDFDHSQPIGGDFSWQVWHQELSAIDTYSISIGPMIAGGFATPPVSSTITFSGKVGDLLLDNMRFRIHGHEALLTNAFRDLSRMLIDFHAEVEERYCKELEARGMEDPIATGHFIPAHMTARLRLSNAGFKAPDENCGDNIPA